MDTVLVLTISMIFLGAMIGTVIRYRTRDKCLKVFSGFFVIAEREDESTVWGNLSVFHNAIELTYAEPFSGGNDGHQETSFIFYKNQFGGIRALKRLHQKLSTEHQAIREKDIRRTYRPNLVRRTGRRLRNMLNLFRDALAQAFGAFVGSVKKTTTSTLIATQDARLTETAKTLLGATASAYEPILERYIGRKVVLELVDASGVTEYCGILKDYSEDFICVLDIPISANDGLMDLVVPRTRAIIRHGAEMLPKFYV